MRKLLLSLLVLAFFAACEKNDPVADLDVTLKSHHEMPNGEHFNLNIIGVKEKVMDSISGGHVIFVNLYGESTINLQVGDEFMVLDKNGTDEDGGLFQLPPPGIDTYVTEDSKNFDTKTDYSVYARPLGKPLTGSEMTLMADTVDGAEAMLLNYLLTKKDEKKFTGLLNDFDIVRIEWGELIENTITFERLKGKQMWQNVTAELLTVVYTIIVYVDDPATEEVEEVPHEFHIRVPIFDQLLEGEYWKYDNNGLKLLQLRFYPFGTDVTYDDIENGWNVMPY